MSQLLKSLCESSSAETVIVLCGLGQSKSVPHYLHESPRSLEQATQPLPVYESLIQKDTP